MQTLSPFKLQALFAIADVIEASRHRDLEGAKAVTGDDGSLTVVFAGKQFVIRVTIAEGPEE